MYVEVDDCVLNQRFLLPKHREGLQSLIPAKSNSYYQAFNVKSLFGEIVSPKNSQVKIKDQIKIIHIQGDISYKQLENDLDVEPNNNGIELVNDLTQILSTKVDMQIGLLGVVRNDDGQTAIAIKNDKQIFVESKCFHGIKLNDDDSNTKEYGIQQLATKSQEKNQQLKKVTFYERKVILQKALTENEKKLALLFTFGTVGTSTSA
nr:hypothetical protein [Tanacetum cinerariifolium]